jgi:predicted Zn-dependent protease
MQRELQWGSGKTDGVSILALAPAGRAAAHGQVRGARELSDRAVEFSLHRSFKDQAASFAAFQSLIEAELGNFAQARVRASVSMVLSRTRTNLLTIAVALAGDSNQAQSVMGELKRRYPSDTQTNQVFVPCALAILQSSHGDAVKALETLQSTNRYELGPSFGFLPIYVRGLVYLRGKRGQEAAAEFQKIFDNRDMGAVLPAYSLSYVGMARAYALAGDGAKSRKAYQDFFALWKDADPDVPILKQAKAEYARLQ